MAKQNAIIVDLDGTISDYTHRKHWIPTPAGSKRTDIIGSNDIDRHWERFHTEAINDKPITEIVSILKWMRIASPNNAILLATGRSDKHRSITRDWISLHRVPYNHLYMRKHGDWRRDIEVKLDMYKKHIEPNYNVLFALEDRDSVCELWRGLGIRTLQVCKGEY